MNTLTLKSMIVHALVLLVGMTGLYYSFVQYQKTRQLLSSGIKTTATVIELIGDQGEDGDLSKPKFRFMDTQHKPVEFTSDISSKPPAYNIGDQVAIVYQPGREDDARVISYWNLFRWTIVLTALSTPFLVIGLGYFLYYLFEGDLVVRM